MNDARFPCRHSTTSEYSSMTRDELIARQVKLALDEDIGSGDISVQLIPETQHLDTELLVREPAVLCGTNWFDQAFVQCDDAIQIDWLANDGDNIAANCVVCRVAGPARGILSAERTALNFLQTLSATATRTRYFADQIKHSHCRILDTRKTIPLLRMAQKYAVRCGGGNNHRLGLYDAYLIKENHLAACGGIANAVSRGRQLEPQKLLEIEVESIAQLRQAIDAGANRALLDNFSINDLVRAVAINKQRIELEASGNINEHTLVQVADTGVDFVSIGGLTKNIEAIDFSLRFVEP